MGEPEGKRLLARLRRKYEERNDNKIDLKELRRRSGTGFIWIRIGNSGLLCTEQFFFGFHKMSGLFA